MRVNHQPRAKHNIRLNRACYSLHLALPTPVLNIDIDVSPNSATQLQDHWGAKNNRCLPGPYAVKSTLSRNEASRIPRLIIVETVHLMTRRFTLQKLSQ